MGHVYGRSCATTLRQGDLYAPLVLCRSTVRSAERAYSLGATIGGERKLEHIRYGSETKGCLIARLDADTLRDVLEILLCTEKTFDVIITKGSGSTIYTELTATEMELRGEAGGYFYLKAEVRGTRNSVSEELRSNVPPIKWQKKRCMMYRGEVTADGKRCKAVYLFRLHVSTAATRETTLSLHFPLRDDGTLSRASEIEKLEADMGSGTKIVMEKLVSKSDMTDISTADKILLGRSYRVGGCAFSGDNWSVNI